MAYEDYRLKVSCQHTTHKGAWAIHPKNTRQKDATKLTGIKDHEPIADQCMPQERKSLLCQQRRVSTGNHTAGFIPAFRDSATGVEPSRLPDGTQAPMHLLAGLPREWVVARDEGNEVLAVKATVVAGFLHAGLFYTREQAAQAVAPVHLTTREWRTRINAGNVQTHWRHGPMIPVHPLVTSPWTRAESSGHHRQRPIAILPAMRRWYLARPGVSHPWRRFFDSHVRVMVYSYQYHLDPMTVTRPLEDVQPLGSVPSHRVI